VPHHHAQLFLVLVLLPLLRLPILLAKLAHQALAIRRPRERAKLALQVGQALRFPARQRNQVYLRLLFILPVGEKSNVTPVRRPPRLTVHLVAAGERPRRAAAGRRQPQVGVLFLLLGVHALHGVHHVFPVRREPAVGNEFNAIQILGRDQTLFTWRHIPSFIHG